MNEQKLAIMSDRHQKYLNNEPGGKKADFSGLDLTWTNFAGMNFSGANFSELDLTWAIFLRTNLTGANFSGSYLHETNFSGANLTRANFSGANFSWANLPGSNLPWSNLFHTNLTDAILYNTIGNGREIKTIISDEYIINYTDKIIQIGNEQHPIDDWFKFSDKDMLEMDGEKALNFWKKWKPILQMILEYKTG